MLRRGVNIGHLENPTKRRFAEQATINDIRGNGSRRMEE
jgi:hypothetical protein